MLNEAMRLRSMTDWNDSRSCGPDFDIVRFAIPPPAVVTMTCRPPSLSTADCRTSSVPAKSVTSTG